MPAVDQLVGRGRCVGEYAEPAVRVGALVEAESTGRNRRPGNAVESIAAGDDVAGDLVFGAVFPKTDTRRARVEVVDAHVIDLEVQRTAGRRDALR